MGAFINSMRGAYMARRNVSPAAVFTDPFIVTQISNTLYSMEVDVTLIAPLRKYSTPDKPKGCIPLKCLFI